MNMLETEIFEFEKEHHVRTLPEENMPEIKEKVCFKFERLT